MASTEYGNTWEETCSANRCTRTLYSGTRYVFEDGEWKPIEDAISLKDIWDVVYLETDKDFQIDVIDYNYTDILIHLNFSGDALDYPEDCTYKSELESKCQFKMQYKQNGIDIKYDYKWEMKNGNIVANTYKFSYKGIPLGKKFTLGGNSTTITLQTANSENLEDAWVRHNNPTTNYGTNTNLGVGNSTPLGAGYGTNRAYIRFNISSIPSGINILDATLKLYADGGDSCTGECPQNHSVYHVYNNATWNEHVITWNGSGEQPCKQGFDNSSYCNLTAESYNDTFSVAAPSEWVIFNVTNTVETEFVLNSPNVSFALRRSNETKRGTFYYNSKEESSNRPQLVIKYSSNVPDVSGMTILPSTVYTYSTLNCSAVYEPNVSNGRIEFMWYKNDDAESYNGSTTNTMNEDDTGYTNVSISSLNDGDVWICAARAWNTTDLSSWENSSSETVIGFPQWYNNQSVTTATYNPDNHTQFNMTWNISGDEPHVVFIEINLTGGTVNFTMTNNTYGGDIYNFSVVLPVGNYYWKSYTNDTDDDWNSTPQWTFSIAQNATNPVHLNLTITGWTTNTTDDNISVYTDQTVNASCWMTYSDSGSCSLFTNNVSRTSPYGSTYGAGTWEVRVNSTGNANYTANSSIVVWITSSARPPGGGGSTGGGGEAFIIMNFSLNPSYTVFSAPERTFTRTFQICSEEQELLRMSVSFVGDHAHWAEIEQSTFTLEAGLCERFPVTFNVPNVPDGDYEIVMQASANGENKQQVKITIRVAKGIGLLKLYGQMLVNKLMFGVVISPDVETGICRESAPNYCIKGEKAMKMPLLGAVAIVLTGFGAWRYGKKRFFDKHWIFTLIAMLIVLVLIPG